MLEVILVLVVLSFLCSVTSILLFIFGSISISRKFIVQLNDFEKRAAESNKAVVEFLIKMAENLDKRIVEVDKRIGEDILANAEDVVEVKANVLRLMEHRNLVDVDRSLDQYLR